MSSSDVSAREPVSPSRNLRSTKQIRLTDLRASGLLSSVDEHLARLLDRLAAPRQEELVLAAALTSAWTRAGHSCLDLSMLVERPVAEALEASGIATGTKAGLAIDSQAHEQQSTDLRELRWPDLPSWREVLRGSNAVAVAGAGEAVAFRPLVLDSGDRLYLQRLWQHQERLAVELGRRAASYASPADAARLERDLERLFPASELLPASALAAQRQAARCVCQRGLTVISGGPGTGKTTTVARILALLAAQAEAQGKPLPRSLLLAPTGKAAARLIEALQAAAPEALAAVDLQAPCSPTFPDEAQTIHRALGPLDGRAARFRHGPQRPLLADLVLVDEASMVDLALMDRLVSALRADARLVLLGDRDQLAAVNAGTVLADLALAADRINASAMAEEGLRTASSARPSGAEDQSVLPGPASRSEATSHSEAISQSEATSEAGGLPQAEWHPRPSVPDPSSPGLAVARCVVELKHSFRFQADGGIGRLAQLLRRGEAEAALELLRDPADEQVCLGEPVAASGLPADLLAACRTAREAWDEGDDLSAGLQALGKFRVLCAHRHGPSGILSMIPRLGAALGFAGQGLQLEPGLPVLIRRNEPSLALYNGDLGLVTRKQGQVLVAFAGSGAETRLLAPSRLPPWEAALAMSVHQAQGSEMEEVAVVLPQRASPVLSRELLYTAVTRARQRVVIHARPEVLLAAVARSVRRSSGLADALLQGAPAQDAALQDVPTQDSPLRDTRF